MVTLQLGLSGTELSMTLTGKFTVGWKYYLTGLFTKLPDCLQNDLWTSFCMAVPHRHFSILQGTAGN